MDSRRMMQPSSGCVSCTGFFCPRCSARLSNNHHYGLPWRNVNTSCHHALPDNNPRSLTINQHMILTNRSPPGPACCCPLHATRCAMGAQCFQPTCLFDQYHTHNPTHYQTMGRDTYGNINTAIGRETYHEHLIGQIRHDDAGIPFGIEEQSTDQSFEQNMHKNDPFPAILSRLFDQTNRNSDSPMTYSQTELHPPRMDHRDSCPGNHLRGTYEDLVKERDYLLMLVDLWQQRCADHEKTIKNLHTTLRTLEKDQMSEYCKDH